MTPGDDAPPGWDYFRFVRSVHRSSLPQTLRDVLLVLALSVDQDRPAPFIATTYKLTLAFKVGIRRETIASSLKKLEAMGVIRSAGPGVYHLDWNRVPQADLPERRRKELVLSVQSRGRWEYFPYLHAVNASNLSQTQRTVLRAMASYVRQDAPMLCSVSKAWLQEDCGLKSLRTVQLVQRQLEALGVIEMVDDTRGPGTYQVHFLDPSRVPRRDDPRTTITEPPHDDHTAEEVEVASEVLPPHDDHKTPARRSHDPIDQPPYGPDRSPHVDHARGDRTSQNGRSTITPNDPRSRQGTPPTPSSEGASPPAVWTAPRRTTVAQKLVAETIESTAREAELEFNIAWHRRRAWERLSETSDADREGLIGRYLGADGELIERWLERCKPATARRAQIDGHFEKVKVWREQGAPARLRKREAVIGYRLAAEDWLADREPPDPIRPTGGRGWFPREAIRPRDPDPAPIDPEAEVWNARAVLLDPNASDADRQAANRTLDDAQAASSRG